MTDEETDVMIKIVYLKISEQLYIFLLSKFLIEWFSSFLIDWLIELFICAIHS